MSEKTTDLDAVGGEILLTVRNELYLNLPYLDVVLCGLVFQPGKDVTLTLATDGQTLYYNGNFLAERYLRGRVSLPGGNGCRCRCHYGGPHHRP